MMREIIEEVEDFIRVKRLRITRSYLRDTQNPFNLSNDCFESYYRLPKFLVQSLIEELQPFLRQSQRNTSIPDYLQVLSFLSVAANAIRVAAIEENPFNIPLDDLVALNDTIEKCAVHITAELLSESSGCPISFDSILCWPKTPLGHTAILPCFKELNGLQYDSTQNATRYCNIDGTWDNVNYERCYHIPIPAATGSPFAPHVEITTYIYFSGYILSLFALSIAVIVFLRLKDLRCLRNKIHLNLFLTYILTALLWILTLIIQLFIQEDGSGCIFLVILLHYFSLTNFFWMMVEGLYLYTLVVQTFSGDNLSLRMYALIGWGGPAIFVICWTIVKAAIISIDDGIITKFSNTPEFECAWLKESYVDWIYQGPACAVLIINSIFLVQIMWVLITKLRSANTIETRQYRKASKALLVLIPLLGTTYLVVLAGPEKGVGSIIFAVIRAFLLSTQGFSVSLFYCFLNSEVRQAIRHRFNIWRDERNISSSTHGQSKRYNTSKDYLRSRTESIRFNSSSPVNSV